MTTTKTSHEDEAYNLLKASSWFESDDVSDTLLGRLASAMTPIDAKAGCIFAEEGQPLTDILVLEKGSLIRTKYAADHPNQVDESLVKLRELADNSKLEFILENSVIVDKIETRGRISGLLHSIREEGKAFATIVAASDDVKVWTLKARDFREIITESPEYTMDVMAAMARELQSGQKSLKGMMEAMEKTKKRSSSSDDSTQTCNVLCYDATQWTTDGFQSAVKAFNKEHEGKLNIDMDFTNERLSEKTASFAAGYDAVCLFVNDDASADVLKTLSRLGVRMISMRSAGFDRVDTKAAKAYGMTVARVPAYSPYAVAEMAVALLMTVNRRIHHASNRVKMGE